MNRVTIYTDGACSGNPGVGGYSFLILSEEGKVLLKLSGGEQHTTNNRMELKAIVRALKHLPHPGERFYLPYYNANSKLEVLVRSDSAYCVNAVKQGWIYTWDSQGWVTKQGYPVKNQELWLDLLEFLQDNRYNITFEKVKGHSGDYYNEMVDEAAKGAINRLKANKSFSKQGEVNK